ncbi:MAG TPA: alkaline phosphatase [Kofleriaceae bacterium]|nr:alkaline phosphatase [Kofleriaceae bacterium]
MTRFRLAFAAALAVATSLVSLLIPRAARPPTPGPLAADRAPPARHAPPAAPSVPAAVVSPPPRAPARPAHVVIISEDGMRPDALTEELAPRHVALMKEATVARRADTIPQSDTLPSHASMLSGFGARQHGLGWNSFKPERGYIHVPTVFSIAEEAGLETAMIVGKPKLRHIAPPGTVGHFERPSYLCGGVARRAAAYFDEHRPDLLFVHFSDPDEYGHSHGWMSPEYRRAVRNSDRCLGTVLDAIERSGLADSTLVIVTADHGGHGRHHSRGHDAVERQIPWIARGPGADEDSVLDAPMTTMDTAATVLAALRLTPRSGMQGVARLTFAP